MLLGVHCSISGGVHNACFEARDLETNTFQIFTKNQRQWKEKQFTSEEIDQFRNAMQETGIKTAFSHASYLINLAHKEESGREKAINALAGEVHRCHDLGLPYTVLHPGFPKDQPEQEGLQHVINGINKVIDQTPEANVKILVENMAGQGSAIGKNFSELSTILDNVKDPSRVGTCFDTCHAFAAGYDLSSEKSTEQVMETWNKEVGFDRLNAIHINDSKEKFGSFKDRHEHIGEGEIGIDAFRFFIKNFPDTPKVLETPKADNMDRVNLKKLKTL